MGKCQLCGQPYTSEGSCACLQEAEDTLKRNRGQDTHRCAHHMLSLGDDGDYFCVVCNQRFNMMIVLRMNNEKN